MNGTLIPVEQETMATTRRFLVLALMAFGVGWGLQPAAIQSAAAQEPKQVAREIAQIVRDGEAPFGSDLEDERLFQVYAYYHLRSFTPIWVRDDGPKTKGRELLAVLQNASADGLEPNDYHVGRLSELMEQSDVRSLARLELLLTRAFLDYGRDLSAGRVEPNSVDSEVHMNPDPIDAGKLIHGAEGADDIGPYVHTLAPQTDEYLRLATMLAEYREMAALGGWPTVPDGETLKPGMDDPRVPALRQYLSAVGDYLGDPDDPSTLFDEELEASVNRFQERHGIDVDGAVGPATLAEMNTPIEERIETMELNMERRRWMVDDLGERYVFVNLADQVLKVVDNGRTIHTARTVVGKPYTRTPVFDEIMQYVVINPDWTVPNSIARNEYLPKLRKSPGALAAQNIHVYAGNGRIDPYSVDWNAISPSNFRYTLRQDPGPGNALGQIKFMFPNQYNIYIHDTPSKGLFARSSRAFSHGCVRVQDPVELGAVILGTQGWTAEKIRSVIASGKKTVVNLEEPLPVHVTYLTAWVNKDGTVNFRNDIYNRDKRLREGLQMTRLVQGG
ncbi:L,D-transpeptidase family protein [Microbaculum marinum]|uniref:L,D-transpeptidase family protein n=1 Tax=Microbaculum marinum TaxID=1764581 RepID=A0AAW9RG01_9HYPH